MPRYFYTAQSLKGEKSSGILEAKDKHELVKILRQEGYLLIQAEPEEEKVISKKSFIKFFWQNLPFLSKVSLKEKMFFTRNLRIMIVSGLPLPRALKILTEQSKNKKFQQVLTEIREKIIKGKSFSESLASHSDIFPEVFQSMIKVGEESGTLEDVLEVLNEQIERENELKSKIIGAMIYPLVIIMAMFGVGILMLVVVVPKLAEAFKELNIELPVTTKLVIFLGTFLAEKWYLVILLILVFLILFRITIRTKIGKRITANLVLKIPVISLIVKKINSAYTVRTLSSLITAGLPIVKSLEVVSRALGNIYFQEAILKAAEKVKKGEKLSQALKPYQNLYSLLVLQMIEVGEETGETSGILKKLADFFEEEIGNTTKNLTSIIEPFLMLLIGTAVGFFAISIIQPIYAILQTVK